VNPREIEAAILAEAKKSQPLHREIDEFAEKAADTVKQFAPVDTGKFKASIKVRNTGTDRDGLPQFEVFSDDDEQKVGAIEYGSHGDAPFAKAALKLGG